MIVRTLLPLLGIGLGVLAGCNRDMPAPPAASAAKPAGGVGVVDLDTLAKQLGRDVQMEGEVQERIASLNSKLTSFKNTLDRLYEEKQASFGETPNEEQQKQLIAMQERMTAQMIESKRKGESELVVYRQKLIEQFREQAKPVLKEVAAERGLSIVIPKNPLMLLTVDPGVEITDEVAKRMLVSQEKTALEPTAEKPRRRESTETSAR